MTDTDFTSSFSAEAAATIALGMLKLVLGDDFPALDTDS